MLTRVTSIARIALAVVIANAYTTVSIAWRIAHRYNESIQIDRLALKTLTNAHARARLETKTLTTTERLLSLCFNDVFILRHLFVSAERRVIEVSSSF